MGGNFENDIKLPSITFKSGGMVINENSESKTPEASRETATRPS